VTRAWQDDLGEELLRLASADNFRDVAGVRAPYPSSDGGVVRRGVLYRSNELQLSEGDARSLADLGVTAIYDLRDQHEVDAHPDVRVPGATCHHLEVFGIPMDSVSRLATPAEATAVMHGVYQHFVNDARARAAFGELLTRIAETEGPQVFHCTAGKDRTGWATVLLLHVLGVSEEVILEDYLLTNTFSTRTREKYLGLVRDHLGEDKVEVYERVLVADEDYLQTAYDVVAAAYGSLGAYLGDGLGLDDRVLDRLRERLLAAADA
jgi:protein-tyrosine phosphatase